MTKARIRWTKKRVSYEAKKYKNRNSFKINCSGGYNFASTNDILEEVCDHMPPPNLSRKRDKDPKVKKLQEYKKSDLQDINRLRGLLGLKTLTISIRKCLACGLKFESIEARTCGCLLEKYDPFI